MVGISARAKAMLADVAPVAPPPAVKEERTGPTPEQMRGDRFKRGSAKTSHGQVNSVAYRRHPHFETLAKGKSGIDGEGLRAMRFYRERHEATARSLTRCALDVQARGGGLPSGLPPGIDADYLVNACEAAMGAVVDTMRAIVLNDQSFSDVAIARFGSRKQNWLETEKQRGRTKKGGKLTFVDKIVPKSGRHREIIREEFMTGLIRLKAAVLVLTSNAAPTRSKPTEAPSLAELTMPEEHAASLLLPLPDVAPEFLDDNGHLRPWDDIAQIIRDRMAA